MEKGYRVVGGSDGSDGAMIREGAGSSRQLLC